MINPALVRQRAPESKGARQLKRRGFAHPHAQGKTDRIYGDARRERRNGASSDSVSPTRRDGLKDVPGQANSNNNTRAIVQLHTGVFIGTASAAAEAQSLSPSPMTPRPRNQKLFLDGSDGASNPASAERTSKTREEF